MQYKISGILNNCALNSALPIMLQDFEDLAKLEENNQLPHIANLDGLEFKEQDDCPYFRNYLLLKEIFAEVYGLQNERLSWQELNVFLKSYNSFLAIQIVFLPVFRKFIGKIDELHYSSYSNLSLLTDIQSTASLEGDENIGKYIPLDIREVFLLFHSKFGITISKYDDGTNLTDTGYNLPQPTWPQTQDEQRCINLYWRAKHFEISESPNSAQENEELNFLETNHKKLRDIILNLSVTTSAHTTNISLAQLRLLVNRGFTCSEPKLIFAEFPLSKSTAEKTAIFFLVLSLENPRYKSRADNLLRTTKIPKSIAYAIHANAMDPHLPDDDIISNTFAEIESSTQELISAINSSNFKKFKACINQNKCDINCLVKLENDKIKITNDRTNSVRLLHLLTCTSYSDNKYNKYRKLLKKKGAEENIILSDIEIAQSYEIQNQIVNPRATHREPSDDISYPILSSTYFKLFMLCLLIIAALTLVALLLSATHLSYVVPAFLMNLSSIAYNAIFGISTGVGVTATIGLAASFWSKSKENVSGDGLDVALMQPN